MLIQKEITVLAGSYLLAGLPIAAAFLLGRISPLYQLPRSVLITYWSRMALVIVVVALLLDLGSWIFS